MSSAVLARLATGVSEWLGAPVDPLVFVWFRRSFLGKFLLFDLLALVKDAGPSMASVLRVGVVAACVILAETPRGPRRAAAVILAIRLLEIVQSFPSTINHAFFDAALLLALAFGAEGEEGRGPHPVRVAQAAIVVVFFHSGLQKVMHGYYADGQFLALRMLYHEGDMGRRLRWLLSSAGGLLALPLPPSGALPRPSGLVETPAILPAWANGTLRVLSNGIWLAEIGLPVIALRARLRMYAVLGLLVLASVVLLFTGEVSFSFTVVTCLLSFFPRAPGRTYPIAFLLLATFAVVLRSTR